MKKQNLKFIVNFCLMVSLSAVAFLGLLLGFVIPRGPARGVEDFLGLGRHDWADMHLYLSLLFLLSLSAHVWLNWSWVRNAVQRYFGDNWKKGAWAAGGAWAALLFILWLAFLH